MKHPGTVSPVITGINHCNPWLSVGALALIIVALAGCQLQPDPPSPSPTPPASTDKALALVSIPGGRFQRDGQAGNQAVVAPFLMAKEEVSRSLFQEVMGFDPSDPDAASGTDDPVQGVTWYQALAFLNKLSLREAFSPAYRVTGVTDWGVLDPASIPASADADWNAATLDPQADGFRLPTEMEWMWAAMGAPLDGQGTSTNTVDYALAFAGSTGTNDIADHGWFLPNSEDTTHPRGSKAPNPLGILDLSGNVEEWTWTGYSSIPDGLLLPGSLEAGGSQRVLKGGSYAHDAAMLSLANRGYLSAHASYPWTGLRLARSQALTVPHRTPYWGYHDDTNPSLAAGVLENRDDGVRFFGTGHRVGRTLASPRALDLAGRTLRTRFKVNGPNGNYMNLGWGAMVEHGTFDGAFNLVADLSTNNTWAGSLVLAHDTWYYVTLVFDQAGGWTGTLATGDFSAWGGTVIKTVTGSNPALLGPVYPYFSFGDNYGGTNAWAQVGGFWLE